MAGKRTAQEQRDYMREYRARKRLEQQTSKSITEGVTGVTSATNIHAGCDRRIAELEAEVRRLSGRQVSTSKVDVSTQRPVEVVDLGPAPSPEQGQVIVDNLSKVPSRPGFLAAKVDDCVSCGHEWHSNEDAGCRAAKGPRDRCGCKAYLNEGEPF